MFDDKLFEYLVATNQIDDLINTKFSEEELKILKELEIKLDLEKLDNEQIKKIKKELARIIAART